MRLGEGAVSEHCAIPPMPTIKPVVMNGAPGIVAAIGEIQGFFAYGSE